VPVPIQEAPRSQDVQEDAIPTSVIRMAPRIALPMLMKVLPVLIILLVQSPFLSLLLILLL